MKHLRILILAAFLPYVLSAGGFALTAKDAVPFAGSELVAGREDGTEFLTVSCARPSLYCTAKFLRPIAVGPKMRLTFEYRVAAEPENRPDYVAVNLIDRAGNTFFHSSPATAEWTPVELPFDGMLDTKGRPLPGDAVFRELAIYGRAKDGAPKPMRLDVRKVTVTDRALVADYSQFQKCASVSAECELVEQSDADGVRLEASCREPGLYCTVKFIRPVVVEPGLQLRFEYRTAEEPECKPDYVAVNLIDNVGESCFQSFPASGRWRSAALMLTDMRDTKGRMIRPGTRLKQIVIYARSRNGAPKKLRLALRNVELTAAADPAAGARVSYSALPMFNWRPAPGATSYRLEYSTDGSFAADKRVDVESPVNFFVPSKPLAAGLYYWRAAVPGSGAVADAGRLLIPARTHEFRLPEYDFSQLAARPHPRLAKLAEFQAKNDPSLVESARALLGLRLPPNPEPFRPGADPAIPSWIEWYRRVADGVVSVTGGNMAKIGRAAIFSGDPALADKAKELALGVAREWDPKRGSHISHGDLQAGYLLEGLGWCYDAAATQMTEEERREVLAALTVRGRQFFERLNPFTADEAQNHPWNQAAVLAFTSLVGAEGDERTGEWFDYALQMFAYRFFPSLGFDGENNEGLQYWSYGGGILMRFADFARHCVGIDFYRHPYLASTARFPLYCAPPDGFHISFSNATQNGLSNHGNFGRVNPAFAGRLAAAAADPYGLWYGGTAQSGTLKAKVPADLPQSKLFGHIGWAVFNTFLPDARENVAVGFHSGKYFAGHQHADQNSFTINAYGDKLAIDGGYYDWYGSEHFKQYSIQTQAHNTILVDGEGQAVHTPGADGRIAAFFDSPGFGYVEGDASDPDVYCRRLDSFSRRLLFLKPDYVIVRDELAAAKGRKTVFSWLLHAHGDATPVLGEAGRFHVIRPKAELVGRIYLPAGRLQCAKSYDVGPMKPFSDQPLEEEKVDREWTISAANAIVAERADFLAGMEIFRAGAAPSPEAELLESADSIGLRSGRFLAAFSRRAEGGITLDSLRSDGRTAAIRFDAAGKVADALLIGGKQLFYQGKLLIDRPRNSDAALRLPEPVNAQELELSLNGKTIAAEYFVLPQPDGGRLHLAVATLPLDENLSLSIRADRAAKAPVLCRLTQGSVALNFEASDEKRLLPRGTYLFSAVSREPLTALELSGTPFQTADALMLAPDYKPVREAVRIEAERPLSGAVGGRIVRKTAASGSEAVCDWGVKGNERADWRFSVPADGRYALLIRAAGVYSGIRRELYCDGAPWIENRPVVCWEATGGWCNGDDSWRYFRLPPVFLKQGEHTLTLKYSAGLSNIDCFSLEVEE